MVKPTLYILGQTIQQREQKDDGEVTLVYNCDVSFIIPASQFHCDSYATYIHELMRLRLTSNYTTVIRIIYYVLSEASEPPPEPHLLCFTRSDDHGGRPALPEQGESLLRCH
jgi:hypothetical protein